jgi:general secretion pathway protein L
MTLHFAFDRQHYRHHRYLIVVTDKQTLLDLMARLDALALDFDCVTLDWFALKENEVCVTDNGLLIYDKSFKGALSGELSTLYLSEREPNVSIMTFKDTNDEPPLNTELIDTPSAMWIAKRLLAADRMNLCQGDLKHDNRQQSNQLWYRLCAGTALVMLVSVLLFKLVYLHALTTKTTDIDKKIAVIYHRFFPEAKQVISPKFRMGQLLSVDASRNEAFVFWVLLDKLARSFKDGSSIQQLNFQNQVLSVTMVSQNFAALEKLQQQLQQLNVKVTQAQAASDEGKVKAILELSL